MSWAVNNIAGSLAGAQQAARDRASEAKRREKPVAGRTVPVDEFHPTTQPEAANTTRDLKAGTHEDAHEDHIAHEGSAPLPESPPRRLDLSA